MCGTVYLVIQSFVLCILAKTSSGIQYTHTNYTRIARQASNNSCALPPHPTFGRWTIYEGTSQLSPGSLVQSRTVLELRCQKNYQLNSFDTVTCVGGKWKPEIGQCLRICPTINSTSIMTVTCSLNEKTLNSCANAFDGTIARFQCARYYEDQAQERDPFRLCSNGNWVGSLPTCVPICGKASPKKDPTLIVGGTVAEKGEYPWQTALYNASNKVLLCGGTLLNQRVILTAAHCITDPKGKLLPKERYMVAVGKYFLQYDDPDDADDAQFSTIYQMYIPRQYKAIVQHYFGDIGIIVTTHIFDLSSSVRPICVMWESKRHQVLADPTRTKHAYVSGWGYTVEHKDPSNVLKHLKVPLITDEECTQKLNEDDIEYLTDDKLCAGFLNSSTSVCKGDSGGGLISKFNKRFYIIGIVSVSPQGYSEEGGCDSQQYTLYTRFSYYIESFILEKEARFRPRLDCEDPLNCKNDTPETTPSTTTEAVTESSISHCNLPDHPKSGKWIIFGRNSTFQPGMSVPSGTVLKIECTKNLKLEGQNLVYCANDKWSSDVGRCLNVCPPRVSTPTMQVKCSYNGKELENCTEAIDGTLAKFQCALFYEDLQLAKRPVHICSDGSWDQAIPQCVPVCGQKSVAPTQLILNGTSSYISYPWHVTIYSALQNNSVICSGSLLSQRVILTAAHCITDARGNLKPKEDYFVTVGNKHRNFQDARDAQVQVSDLEEIFIPKEFRGDLQNYLGDIAILVTKKTFKVSKDVQPVCLDIAQNYKLSENENGFVSSWGILNPNSTDVLKDQTNLYISQSKCRNEIPENFEVFLTHDKICSRSVNKGIGCQVESGAGLVYKHESRYYITGLASLSPVEYIGEDRKCSDGYIVLYTDVSNYLNSLILSNLAAYKT